MYYNYHNKFLKYYNKTLKYQIGGDNISKINKFIAIVSFVLFIVFSYIIKKRTAYKTAKLLEQKLQDCTIDIPNLIDELIKYYDKLSSHSFTKTLIYMLNKTINFESLNELYTSVIKNKCQLKNNSEEKIHLQKSYRSLVNKGSKIIDVSYKNNKIETITYDFDKAILKLSMIKLILYTIKYCDSIKYQKIINVICEQITVSKNKSKYKEKLRKRDIIKLLPIIKVYHYKNISNIKMKEEDRKTATEDRKTTVEYPETIKVNTKVWTLFKKTYPEHPINMYLKNGALYQRDCGGGGDCMFYAIAEILNNSRYVFTYPENDIHEGKKGTNVEKFNVETLREILADFYIDIDVDVTKLKDPVKYIKYRNRTTDDLNKINALNAKLEKKAKEIKDKHLDTKEENILMGKLPRPFEIDSGPLEHYIISYDMKEEGFANWTPTDIITLKDFQNKIKEPGIIWGDDILLSRLQYILDIYFVIITPNIDVYKANGPVYCAGTLDSFFKTYKKSALLLNHRRTHYEALGHYNGKELSFLFNKFPDELYTGYNELCPPKEDYNKSLPN